MWTTAGIINFVTYGLTRLALDPTSAWRVTIAARAPTTRACWSILGLGRHSLPVRRHVRTHHSTVEFVHDIENEGLPPTTTTTSDQFFETIER